MTSLIEQAARRLAQLREAGVEIPDEVAPVAARASQDEGQPAAVVQAAARQPSLADASHHPAVVSKQVQIDLDDGVKVNYAKFGKALKVIKGLGE